LLYHANWGFHAPKFRRYRFFWVKLSPDHQDTTNMAHEVPASAKFTGLSRKVIAYSERFASIVAHIKDPQFPDALWQSLTEQGNRVILELEERNTRGGFTHIANTVAVYGFNDAGRVRTLEVYVMSLNGSSR
jgi:hypothetical protein